MHRYRLILGGDTIYRYRQRVLRYNRTQLQQLTNQTLTFFAVIKPLAIGLFCLCALTTMVSMLTMADGGDYNSKVKIEQPPPLFKTKVWRHFGFKATKTTNNND